MATEIIVSAIVGSLVSAVAERFLPDRVEGVDIEVRELVSNLRAIQFVLGDADQRQATDQAVKRWLDDVKQLSYDIEGVLDEWNSELLKLRIQGRVTTVKKLCFEFLFPCSCFNHHQVFAMKIKDLNKRLENISREKNRFNFSSELTVQDPERLRAISLFDLLEMYGRADEKKNLISKLVSDGREEQRQRGLHIISLVGMRGVGKTALAQFAFNDQEVMRHFDKRIWVRVSSCFDELRIASLLLEALKGTTSYFHELEYCLQHISQSIVGRKFLLVLDDVRIEDYNKLKALFRCLRNGLHGSKLFVTTRKESVARLMGSNDTTILRELSEENSWPLFSHIAFVDRTPEECQNLEDIGKKILRKCNGLPLAVRTIASVLRFKRTAEQWQSILHNPVRGQVEFESGLPYALWLSYNNLPYQVKQCFSYCAIFPKDCYLDKHNLIQLWMSQGYLGLEEEVELEKIGEDYFNILAAQSLLQGFEKDDDGNVIRCKMHHLVHDFAQSLSENEYLTIDVDSDPEELRIDSYHEKLRHSMLMFNKGVSFPDFLIRAKNLWSLLIEFRDTNYSSISQTLRRLFSKLTSLRAFGLSGNLRSDDSILHLPREIGQLINLRYLNFSSLKIDQLPQTLCELYNLETLVLRHCIYLKQLPEGIGRLQNLRHIVNDGTSLSYMPKEIGKLYYLLTLSEFVVSRGDDDSKACTLASLKYLNYLEGSLRIKNLGTVTHYDEVREAELQKKRYLNCLCLNFENDAEEVSMSKDEGILESFQPPANIQRLEIGDYKGSTCSLSWIMSLSRLRTLNFHNCKNMKHLPPLGKLTSLQSVSICGMGSVKRVGKEFLGIESGGASSSSSVILFPKLQSLKFVNMEDWEDWEVKDCGIAIMPNLRCLSLVNCPTLKILPLYILQTEMLEELNINRCRFLKKRFNRWTGQDWHSISHISRIMIS